MKRYRATIYFDSCSSSESALARIVVEYMAENQIDYRNLCYHEWGEHITFGPISEHRILNLEKEK